MKMKQRVSRFSACLEIHGRANAKHNSKTTFHFFLKKSRQAISFFTKNKVQNIRAVGHKVKNKPGILYLLSNQYKSPKKRIACPIPKDGDRRFWSV